MGGDITNNNTFKTIIIVCLVAIVVILGISAYFFISNNNQASATNNTLSSNQTLQNASNITSKNETNSKSTAKSTEKAKTNLISSQRAIDIVEQSAPGSDKCTFSAKLYKNNGAPYYLVTAYDAVPGSSTYGEGIGGAKVDARTGVILDEMG